MHLLMSIQKYLMQTIYDQKKDGFDKEFAINSSNS